MKFKARCPRVGEVEDPYWVDVAECRRCEKIRGPCDYAEIVRTLLTDLERVTNGP